MFQSFFFLNKNVKHLLLKCSDLLLLFVVYDDKESLICGLIDNENSH